VSDKKIIIPKFAGAGVAFAGVEIQDAFLLFAGVLVGFVAGWLGLGLKGFVGIPLICYFATTWYLEWKEGTAPGQVRTILFRLGLFGYSRAFPTANMVYVGDSKALNPASRQLIEDRASIADSLGGH
jgi:hypothetical protein